MFSWLLKLEISSFTSIGWVLVELEVKFIQVSWLAAVRVGGRVCSGQLNGGWLHSSLGTYRSVSWLPGTFEAGFIWVRWLGVG